MQKKILRRYALSIRRGLSQEAIKRKSKKIQKNLFNLSLFKRAGVVLFYLSLPDEVQTYGMIKDSLKIGKRIAVPVVDLEKGEIVPFEVKTPEFKLVSGPFGISEPAENNRYPLVVEEIDLVVVPGIAFDKQGKRIGFGKGFYDRFLSRLINVKTVALAFECQIFGEVPYEEYDIPVDFIITEKRVINCYCLREAKDVS